MTTKDRLMAEGHYTTHAERLVVTPEGATVVGPSRRRDGLHRPVRVTVEGSCRVVLSDDGQTVTVRFEQEAP